MDCSLPGSSIHGIFPARVLEWGAIAFSVQGKWVHTIFNHFFNELTNHLLKSFCPSVLPHTTSMALSVQTFETSCIALFSSTAHYTRVEGELGGERSPSAQRYFIETKQPKSSIRQ